MHIPSLAFIDSVYLSVNRIIRQDLETLLENVTYPLKHMAVCVFLLLFNPDIFSSIKIHNASQFV